MQSPQLTPEQITQVSTLLANYIATQRALYAPRATSLEALTKAKYSGFFSDDLLDNAVLILAETKIANPGFYPMLQYLRFNLPDMAAMSAVTFIDTIVSHEPFTDRLLFHELVHVAQYRKLGVAKFSELYARGFLSGGGYKGIPLEKQAYRLDALFDQHPERAFSVEADVDHLLSCDLF